MNRLYVFLTAFLITLIFTIVILIKLIPYLKSKKIGQKILEIGPRWHKNKEGTPTMGGIAFIISSIIAMIICLIIFYNQFEKSEIVIILDVFVYAILNALIGLIDDIAKMRKQKNEGLTPKTKLIFQSIAAILFLISSNNTANVISFIIEEGGISVSAFFATISTPES